MGNSNTRSTDNLQSMQTVASGTDVGGTFDFRATTAGTGQYIVIWFTKMPPAPAAGSRPRFCLSSCGAQPRRASRATPATPRGGGEERRKYLMRARPVLRPPPDDPSLTPSCSRQHVAGDPDAFGELFRRHRDRLWAVALRTLGDPEEAADALQDAHDLGLPAGRDLPRRRPR